MVTFNNEFKKAHSLILGWSRKAALKSVTIVRDVFAKLTFLMETVPESFPSLEQRQEIEQLLSNQLQGFFSGNLYWQNAPQKDRPPDILVDFLKELRDEGTEEDSITFYHSERPVAKKAWVCRGINQESVWPYQEALTKKKPRTVTFYSFKGGMGRTTALAATALLLARRGKNVMMVDTDIEAPGLSTLFFDNEVIECGVLDYLIEHPLSQNLKITRYIQDVTEPELLREEDGRLYLMPAGKVDDYYLQKLARIDYQDNSEGALKRLLCELLKDIRLHYEVDYILIDARAGFHDLGGVTVAQIPHGALLFGNNSRQSWAGINQVLRTIAESHTDELPVGLVSCMSGSVGDPSYLAEMESFTRTAYTACVDNYYGAEESIPGVEAKNVAHAPLFLPFDSRLRQNITLFSTGSAEETARMKAIVDLLTARPYHALLERIAFWFGEEEDYDKRG